MKVKGKLSQNLYYKLNSNLLLTDHVERKVLKYKDHKLRERKVKTLTRN